jgi:Cu/Ag efflux protein CusF
MNKTMMIAALITLPIGLSGCDKQQEAPKAAATSDAMSGMAMPAGAKMGKATGTVIAINAAAGTITLEHSAIPAVGWSAMTMGFSAKPGMLSGIAVGDKVDFDVTVTGSAGEVTAIKKQ